jgi:hypothetical protein
MNQPSECGQCGEGWLGDAATSATPAGDMQCNMQARHVSTCIQCGRDTSDLPGSLGAQ